jgi:carbon-monoxide dehydrogenase medium subunit
MGTFGVPLPERLGFVSMRAVAEPFDLPRVGQDAMHARFEYHRPSTVAEACVLLKELGPGALPLAGGTDVLVDLRRGSREPRHLVSLADLNELRNLVEDVGELRIGALVTPHQLEHTEAVITHWPELLDAVGVFGTPQVRHRATVGGSLCTAASCGDLAPLLMALGARVVLAGPQGREEVSLEAFFRDHRQQVLEEGQLLAEVVLPVRGAGEGAAYRAFGLRKANYITVAAVAAFVRMEDGVCAEARITLGAVAPTPLTVPEAAALLRGRPLSEELFAEAAARARDAALPISDLRGSAEHRRELVAVLCRRALRTAEERAR